MPGPRLPMPPGAKARTARGGACTIGGGECVRERRASAAAHNEWFDEMLLSSLRFSNFFVANSLRDAGQSLMREKKRRFL